VLEQPADQAFSGQQSRVILFGDAVHAQHNTVSEYCWIAKGSQKRVASNSARQRINLHGAIARGHRTGPSIHTTRVSWSLTLASR